MLNTHSACYADFVKEDPLGEQPAELLIMKIKKMGIYCITRLLTWAVLLYKNMNLKTLDPSPPTNPNLPLRKLCPVLGICHTPIINAVDAAWSLDHSSSCRNFLEKTEQWEFKQALHTNSSVTTVTIHLIRDTFSNVKMQTNVRLQS